jgi:hypothetical protein
VPFLFALASSKFAVHDIRHNVSDIPDLVPAPADPEATQIIKLHNSVVFFGNQTLMIAVQ